LTPLLGVDWQIHAIADGFANPSGAVSTIFLTNTKFCKFQYLEIFL